MRSGIVFVHKECRFDAGRHDIFQFSKFKIQMEVYEKEKMRPLSRNAVIGRINIGPEYETVRQENGQ